MFLKNRSFNVKLVNDKLTNEPTEEPSDPVQNILIAQAYAAIGKEFVTDITATIVLGAATVFVVKTVCNVVNLGAKALFK